MKQFIHVHAFISRMSTYRLKYTVDKLWAKTPKSESDPLVKKILSPVCYSKKLALHI